MSNGSVSFQYELQQLSSSARNIPRNSRRDRLHIAYPTEIDQSLELSHSTFSQIVQGRYIVDLL
jgi:hypothetical protein